MITPTTTPTMMPMEGGGSEGGGGGESGGGAGQVETVPETYVGIVGQEQQTAPS